MAPNIELTLEEVAKIALGAPELTSLNVHALHNLINIIMKKIDCHNDTVSIRGLESKCLAKLLEKSKPPPFQFDASRVQPIQPKFLILTDLENSIEKTQTKLDNHIEASAKFSKMPETKLEVDDYEHYELGASGQCIPCEEERNLSCFLANDFDYLKKLQRRLASPMILQLFDLETDISKLNEDINEFIQEANENMEKIALIDGCLEQVENLREVIEERKLKFLGTMEEVQDILDIKLDKVYVPALKMYIREKLNKMDRYVADLKKETTCPKIPGVVSDGLRCLSCGDQRVCMEKDVYRTGILPDASAFKPTKLPKECPCKFQTEIIKLADFKKVKVLSVDMLPKLTNNIVKISDDYCRFRAGELKLLEGSNGTLYRRGENDFPKKTA